MKQHQLQSIWVHDIGLTLRRETMQVIANRELTEEEISEEVAKYVANRDILGIECLVRIEHVKVF